MQPAAGQSLEGEASAAAGAPARRLTMGEAIKMAQEQSIQSMVNKNVFAAAYWQWRSYKAGRLPSLNLNAGVFNVDKSRVALQNYDTGEFNYKDVYTISNDATLSFKQNISLTGGTLSLSSSLKRLDQFKPDNLTWYSQPITLTYLQPLFGYNSFKWSKRIEPKAFERAKVEYLEQMEGVTITAVTYFWNLAAAELNHRIAVESHENSKRLYRIAEERYKIGSIKRDEVLQLELRVLNDSLTIGNTEITLTSQRNRLASFVGLRDDVELAIDYSLPDLKLDYAKVLTAALENSSFDINQRVELLEAERGIAQAQSNRGIDVKFNARFGLSQSGETFSKAYAHLRDQQVAGFSIGIPILDWGVGRGRVRMAQSNAERVRHSQEQARRDYEQDIFVRVMEFNAKGAQCDGARRAGDIAERRFAISVDNFTRGTLSVTELNTAQSEKNSAQRDYISNLADYWNAYYNLRKISLYDYLSQTDIGEAFNYEKLVK